MAVVICEHCKHYKKSMWGLKKPLCTAPQNIRVEINNVTGKISKVFSAASCEEARDWNMHCGCNGAWFYAKTS